MLHGAFWWTVLLLTLGACGTRSQEPGAFNLIDMLSERKDLSTFTLLLQRTRLIPALNRIQELGCAHTGMTLFVPNNDAFEAATRGDTPDATFWQNVLHNTHDVDNINVALRQLLWYHVLNYTLPERGPQMGIYETLHFPSRKRIIEPSHPGVLPQPPDVPPHPGAEDEGDLLGRQGQFVRVRRAQMGSTQGMCVGVDSSGRGGAKVLRADRTSSSSVLFTIDKVVPLPPTLEQFLRTNHDIAPTFANMQETALHAMSKTAHLTLFLPSAKSMSLLSPLERTYIMGPWPMAQEDRMRLFGWHASSIGLGDGEIGYANRLREALAVNMTTILGGQVIVHTAKDSRLFVNQAMVVQEDNFVESGVVHIIDGLHLPYGTLGMTLEKYLLALHATKFVQLMRQAGLGGYFDEPKGAYTYIVPSNEALDRWLEHRSDSLETLGASPAVRIARDQAALRAMLLYHILPEKHAVHDLFDGMLLPTELRLDSLGGAAQQVDVQVHNTAKTRGTGIAFRAVGIRKGPVHAGNAFVYLADDVMHVPLDPMQTALESTRTLSTFVASLHAAGTDESVRTDPLRTYFVPVDAGFAKLGLVAKYLLLHSKESAADLSSVLAFISVHGLQYASTLPRGWTPLRTAASAPLFARRDNHGQIHVRAVQKGASANAVQQNILTSTGTMHLLNSVPFCPRVTITMEKLARAAKTTQMLRLVRRAGFGWVLDGTAPHPAAMAALQKRSSKCTHPKLVLLAPEDKAFAQLNMTQIEEDMPTLRALVLLHILLVETCDKSETIPGLQLPVPLWDNRSYMTLSDKRAGGQNQWGELAFRRVQEPEPSRLGYVVGVMGARGTSGFDHSAAVLEYGRTFMPADNVTVHGFIPGGILTIDTVLQPFHPIWIFRWGWAGIIVLLGVPVLCVFATYAFAHMRTRRGYVLIPDALEGEEE
ncbi:hypothetical protein MVES1_002226 [Malassezia vespertilionis]|uniref:FAS1 domain-containing protein n=1 Tax=Malassezia vespertilionis TaxID=2020962 RepID=A0A2N1JC27_9BASI|nr:uncharacterized protein MVES1_002226 [Malassezia vespertilionis]PKI84087.1 hypothetical protein MVES_002100 [Malassezia vespertilionis]WFD06871.1 hypothetical protein MVES1_002226 [Malassezia vespertilionis]